MTVAGLALDALEHNPSEPMLLNCAGIACYELWALEGARALFSAAARLDPGLPHLANNRAEVGRRLAAARPRRPLHAAVPGLVRRAKTISRRAAPTPGLTLSLCMIVRDEERMLGRCLTAAAPVVDEIVIVDTGSTDRTIEIAKSFGARVIERPWTGSFADARNVSFEAATGDWLLYLDADEVLVSDDAQRLRKLTGMTWREAFRLTETNFVGDLAEGTAVASSALRLFRNRPEYRFSGALHEQILHTLPTWAPGRVEQTSIRIEHYGYLGDVRAAKDKSARNLEILREQLAATPTPSAFLHFNLGCEYAAVGDMAGCVRELGQAWSMLEAAGTLRATEYAPRLMHTMARALRLAGRPADAYERAVAGLKVLPDCTDLVLEQANAAFVLGHLQESRELCRRCIELGDAPAEQGGIVGSGTYMPRIALARMALQRNDCAEAIELLQWCLENHPEFPGVAGPYAEARLRRGDDPDVIVSTLDTHLAALPAAARFALARLLARTGAGATVEAQYRRVLEEVDERRANPARTALAELLLGRGEFAEAARLAALVGDDEAFGGLACRIETAAQIALGGLDAARAAASRGTAVGLSRSERDVFSAWIDGAQGEPPATGLSVACVPLLATMMEFMLRGDRPEQVRVLETLLTGSRLQTRERLQLLGETFLRHDRLTDAERAWRAACAEAPDARAQFGLAQIAARQKRYEDAATLAREALALDRSCSGAARLLEILRPVVRAPEAGALTAVDG